MPIVGEGNDVRIKYSILEEIKREIPDAFYVAFAGELFSVFGSVASEKDEDGFYGIDFLSGTTGWAAALRAACQKMRMQWLLDYYDTLEWYDSDMFDGEISDMVIKKSYEADETNANEYYLYLIRED